ncbi:related to M.leprae yfcA protein [Rhynchosporium agropyri]|uniref:Related to M.leprae yfcA protein n=3 Tax=Rhynchosporium TaxID=38037 RepID=A0A1E1MM66_RHYSE|nr:related to M.leprae yfcA protein [Rhynchosporium agropyri]CZT05480.1 related to M.leprae yfcA protein [Rhynchosporium commune]CZT50179.1 related to M.leprae yfcA protein [Rhynchosporium secalis]
MTTSSRVFRPILRQKDYICAKCLFSSTSSIHSGHSRWSKIKHDKGAVDAKKNVQRSQFSREIALASKLFGPDVTNNYRLAAIMAAAKKAGLPKALLEGAIARGQGKSTSGAALEAITLEVIVPPTVAMIIESETDNRARTLMDLRLIIKKHGGSVTPTGYLFQKKGRIAFEADEMKTADEVLDAAIEAGAEDVETDDGGSIVIWTEPNMTTAAADALFKSHGLKVESADIIWDANEDTKVPLKLEDSDAVKRLSDLISELRDNTNVQGIYANVSQGNLSDEVWEELQGSLDA